MMDVQQIKIEYWDKSLHALGTSYVFSLKAKRLKTALRIISLLGIIIPILLGGILTGYKS